MTMPVESKPAETQPKRAPTLYIIAGIKIGKGLLLVLVALGIFAAANQDLQNDFERFVRWLGLDPEKRFFTNIGEWLDTVTAANMKVVASGTLIYGLFLLASGTGLALRAAWAIWLAIGESAFFIPIEIYELVRRRTPDADMHHMFTHPKVGLLLLLAANIFIVWYLYKNRERLFRHHH
jgi:uncharacterized membrane protein (DUF2068 family)